MSSPEKPSGVKTMGLALNIKHFKPGDAPPSKKPAAASSSIQIQPEPASSTPMPVVQFDLTNASSNIVSHQAQPGPAIINTGGQQHKSRPSVRGSRGIRTFDTFNDDVSGTGAGGVVGGGSGSVLGQQQQMVVPNTAIAPTVTTPTPTQTPAPPQVSTQPTSLNVAVIDQLVEPATNTAVKVAICVAPTCLVSTPTPTVATPATNGPNNKPTPVVAVSSVTVVKSTTSPTTTQSTTPSPSAAPPSSPTPSPTPIQAGPSSILKPTIPTAPKTSFHNLTVRFDTSLTPKEVVGPFDNNMLSPSLTACTVQPNIPPQSTVCDVQSDVPTKSIQANVTIHTPIVINTTTPALLITEATTTSNSTVLNPISMDTIQTSGDSGTTAVAIIDDDNEDWFNPWSSSASNPPSPTHHTTPSRQQDVDINNNSWWSWAYWFSYTPTPTPPSQIKWPKPLPPSLSPPPTSSSSPSSPTQHTPSQIKWPDPF